MIIVVVKTSRKFKHLIVNFALNQFENEGNIWV
jgi:hypothetical protein